MTNPSPRPTPTPRRNPGRPAAHMRADVDQAARDAAADKVASAWRQLCQDEPLMLELLLPRELREALGELAQASAS